MLLRTPRPVLAVERVVALLAHALTVVLVLGNAGLLTADWASALSTTGVDELLAVLTRWGRDG